jgi:hypothetical protein
MPRPELLQRPLDRPWHPVPQLGLSRFTLDANFSFKQASPIYFARSLPESRQVTNWVEDAVLSYRSTQRKHLRISSEFE